MGEFDWAEVAARDWEPRSRPYATPGELAVALDPRTIQTPALDLVDAALVELADTPDGRLIITMAPQEGKSVRVSKVFPVWLMMQNPELRVVGASYGQPLANRNGRAIRNTLTAHPELGLSIAPDNGAVHDWTIAGHEGGVLSVGVGAGVTGRPADLLIIDDPIKDRKEADSLVFRDGVWDWWTDSASARLAPGAPVVVILTRWHHDDLAARLLERDPEAGWKVLNIPAQCEVAEGDPLGRQVGEFMRSARGRSERQWQLRKATAGARTWAALYQGHPSPDGGDLFKPEAWATYSQPLWIEREGVRLVPDVGREVGTELCQSWDFTFKDKHDSDFVVGQVWLRRGTTAYLLDQVRGQWSFSECLVQMRALSARWPQAVAKLVEDKANGPAIMNALAGVLGGLIPVEPEGSKYARAEATTPLWEASNVVVPAPELAPWIGEFRQEHLDFPNGANDDQVDGGSQALHRLLLMAAFGDELYDEHDFEDEAAGLLSISPF